MSEIERLDELRERVAEHARRSIEASISLPPACYTSPQFFELEREKIFQRDWLCVGRAPDIPKTGDYLAFDIPGYALMVVRQSDGGVRAFSRVCRHRGAPVCAPGHGRAKLFVCPYHRWTYGLDGRLRGAPTMRANPSFDAETTGLPEYAVELWQGFIFVTLCPAATSLSSALASVADRIAARHVTDLESAFSVTEEWDVNWKVAFENSCETYHHMGGHPSTLEPLFPTLGTRCEAGETSFNLHVVPAATHGPTDDIERSGLLSICSYPSLVLVCA